MLVTYLAREGFKGTRVFSLTALFRCGDRGVSGVLTWGTEPQQREVESVTEAVNGALREVCT